MMRYLGEIAEGRHDPYPHQVAKGKEEIAKLVEALATLHDALKRRYLKDT
jgi:hypothetical protein